MPGRSVRGIMTDKILTDFQVKCEQQLHSALANIGMSVSNREISGKSEKYIHGDIETIKFWIYTDGAEFKSSNCHLHFEKPDYKSLDLLMDNFISKILLDIKHRTIALTERSTVR